MRRTTIKDVAEEAGVSIGTVSAVLNRRDSVRSVTRKRVLKIIDTLNYRPVEAARRRLSTPREKTLGLVIKEIHNPYFADIIVGAQEEARNHHYRLLVMSSEQVIGREIDAVNVLVAKDIDGLIINPLMDPESTLSHFEDLVSHNIPFVMLEGLHPRFTNPSIDKGKNEVHAQENDHVILNAAVVDIDNEKGAHAATQHLVDLGHINVVHLAGPAYSQHTLERCAGVLRAAPHGRIVHAGATLKDGYKAVIEHLADIEFTALVCYNDLVAIGAIKALEEQGKCVPDQVSVVGFDDIEVASYLHTPLTTVRVPKKEMGRQAVATVIQHIHSSTDTRGPCIVLDAELVVRSSTKQRT